MKLFKMLRKGSAVCLIFAVLILGIGTAYCSASDMGNVFETVGETRTGTAILLEQELLPETENEQTETEHESEVSETEEETEEQETVIEEWQDCAMYRLGGRSRTASATMHRDENIILSYLDFPCYFKYATNHGQDTGGKTLAVYCVYNTREAPQDKVYVPDGTGAFSKEITYCLYNGCRYKGSTAYNAEYSAGNWKKDYYITQMAIHIINAEQGRESSIKKQLNKSSNKKIYNLIEKMVADAYADTTLTSAVTNQTRQVNYTITPDAQSEWIRQADGTWRTAKEFSCSSNLGERVISVDRTLGNGTPQGTSIVVKNTEEPLSSFYIQATESAYRQIVRDHLKITAELTVIAQEYGGWWYVPASSSVKRQYVTFLSLEAGESEIKPKVTVSADHLEQKAELTIYKEGEMLTGAVSSEEGIQFRYSKRRLAGAVFELYAGEEIKNEMGESVWKKDALVAGNLVTDKEGSVTIKNLFMGNYYLIEKEAPSQMVLDPTPHKVVLTPENASAELTLSSVVLNNVRQKVEINLDKKDSITNQPLAGAVFGVYAGEDIYSADKALLVKGNTLIGKAVTNAEGTAWISIDLPVGYHYYIEEIEAPLGYVRDTEFRCTFFFADDASRESQQISVSCINERCSGVLILQKKDKETQALVPQGDASLAGAKYGLFAREEIFHPDGHTGILYQKDQQVTVLETDSNGEARIQDLYLGRYYLKELAAPEGYVLDGQEYDVVFSCEKGECSIITKSVTVEEQVKKQSFQIIKGSDRGDENPEALEGAGFTAWLVSDLTEMEKTDLSENREEVSDKKTYNTAGISPVVLGPNGETELFTDEKGYLCTIPLPYGIYLVRETTVPKEHKPVEDFFVTISEHSPDQPQPWRILLDECFMAKLKIIKKDCISGRNILVPGAEFKVKNLDTEEYVHQKTDYPIPNVYESYHTNEEGYLILPKELPPGNYQIEEVTAPEGYICSSDPVEIRITSDEAFLGEMSDGEIVFCQEFYDQPVKGTLKIRKKGNVLTGFDGVFQYEERSLPGVIFEVLAEEDILTSDRQALAETGNAVLYKKGTMVAEVITDENGEAVLKDLPLGTYRIREKQAPFGFLTDTEGKVISLSYEGQNTPEIIREVTCYNERQNILLLIKKQEYETEEPLAGALYGLYASEDIKNVDETIIVSGGECLNQIRTDEEGIASFDLNLPHGLYYVKELQAPEGYVTDTAAYEIDLRECDGETLVIQETLVLENQKTECEISKADLTSGEEIPGATLELRDENGNLMERWISGAVPHKIKGLKPGVSYTLTELLAPYGYVRAESITFQIKDTWETQQIQMLDTHAMGKLLIRKEDADTGKALAGAVFELRDDTGKVLEILKTDGGGKAESGLYEIGYYKNGGFTGSRKYILVETRAPEGYEIDSAEHEIIFPYENGDASESVMEKRLKNTAIEKENIVSSAVQTGDHTDLFGLLCMLFLSGETVLALLIFRRKMR